MVIIVSMVMTLEITEMVMAVRVEVRVMVMKLLELRVLVEMVVFPGVIQQGTLPGISIHVMKVMK